jgi:hypothetical protein
MRIRPFTVLTPVFVLAVAIASCAPEVRPNGELGLGSAWITREATLDFDRVFCGQRATDLLVVKNFGEGELRLVALEQTGGDPIRIGGTGPADAEWEIQFEPQTLAPRTQIEFAVGFRAHPREDLFGTSQVQLLLRTEGAESGLGTASIALRAKVFMGDLYEFPKVIDFRNVRVGDGFSQAIDLRNPTQKASLAFVGEISSSSGDAAHFEYDEGSPRGEFEIPADATQEVRITFRPTELKTFLAFSKMNPWRDECGPPDFVVQLTGTGVSSLIVASPDPVEFGYAFVGEEVRRTVTISNIGNLEAELTGFAAASNAEFEIHPADGDPERLAIPGRGGARTVEVVSRPARAGTLAHTFVLEVGVPGHPPLELSAHITAVVP